MAYACQALDCCSTDVQIQFTRCAAFNDVDMMYVTLNEAVDMDPAKWCADSAAPVLLVTQQCSLFKLLYLIPYCTPSCHCVTIFAVLNITDATNSRQSVQLCVAYCADSTAVQAVHCLMQAKMPCSTATTLITVSQQAPPVQNVIACRLALQHNMSGPVFLLAVG